jgi:hypothetical protein
LPPSMYLRLCSMRRPRNAADGAIDAWIDRHAKRKVRRPRGSLARGLAPARLGTAAICAKPTAGVAAAVIGDCVSVSVGGAAVRGSGFES